MFVYHNSNPKGLETSDCVIRAISYALDIDYYEVINMLIENSNYFNCDALVKSCYGTLLSLDFGLEQYWGMGKTVEEVANDFSDSKVIMRIKGHLTCSKYGVVYDIWDTSDEIVDTFWVVREKRY